MAAQGSRGQIAVLKREKKPAVILEASDLEGSCRCKQGRTCPRQQGI
jgi:hypothetical protein